jgi:hypothetical protein
MLSLKLSVRYEAFKLRDLDATKLKSPSKAGITHCFVNLGSDHPSIMEAMAKGAREKKGNFPRTITCPHEVRSLVSFNLRSLYAHRLADGSTING